MRLARRARAAFRLARVALHLAWGAATVACAYPFLAASPRLHLKRRWSRQLLAILGVRLEHGGEAKPVAGLIVCNHVSWLDIFAVNALAPAAFVCKAEVRAWPLIGWLCARTDTIFLERGSARAAVRTAGAIEAALREGRVVAVFPEGTTGTGERLLPFHPALLQPAIDAGCPVRPLAIGYRNARGERSAAAAYAGETSFAACLAAIVAEPFIRAALHVGEELETAGRNRRELAAAAEERIGQALAGSMRQSPSPRKSPALPGCESSRANRAAEVRSHTRPVHAGP